MTMTTTNTENEYVGNGVLKDYTFTFRFDEIADVKVYVNSVLQVKDTDYTVTYTSAQLGGDLTFTVAPGDTLAVLIQRQTPQLQENNYTSGPFPAESVEGSEDRLTMMIQELETSSTPEHALPAPESDKIIGWNTAADALENKEYPDISQAEADAAEALATANAAEITADNAQAAADSARAVADTADAKADTNTTNLAGTEAKASSALSLATNNEADIAAIDVSSYVPLTTYTPEQDAQDVLIGENKTRSEDNETALVPIDSRITSLEDAEQAINGAQNLSNSTTGDINAFLVDADSETSWLIFFELARRTDTSAQTANGIMYLNWDGDSWVVERGTTFGNYDGVEFNMTQLPSNEGQLTYTTDNLSGLNYNGEFKYQAWKFKTGATFSGTNDSYRTTFIKSLHVGNLRSAYQQRAALNVASDEGGLSLPEFTTAQRDLLWVPPLQLEDRSIVIYNTTTGNIQFHNGVAWISMSTSTLAGFYNQAFDEFADDLSYLAVHGIGGGSFTNDYSVDYNITNRGYTNHGDLTVLNSASEFSLTGWTKVQTFLETLREGNLGMLYLTDGDINATYGDDSGALVPSLFGGATPEVADGFIEFDQNDARALNYPATNFKCDQEGTIKFIVKPNYTGVPAAQLYFLTVYETGQGLNDAIFIRHTAVGTLECRIYGGGTAATMTSAGWLPNAGQSYTIEVGFTVATNTYRMFIDGILVGSSGAALTRDGSTMDNVIIGGYTVPSQISNFSLKQVEFFDTQLHDADYEPYKSYGLAVFSKEVAADTRISGHIYNSKLFVEIANGASFHFDSYINLPVVASDAWTFLSFAWDGTAISDADRFKIYLNATQMPVVFSGTAPAVTANMAGADFLVGKSGDEAYDGQIDEISLWDRSLTPAEIDTLYNSGQPTNIATLPFVVNCTDWWRMGDSDVYPTLANQIGANDASMMNMTAVDIVNDAPAAGIGSPIEGSVYWNTTNATMRAYTKGQWWNIPPFVQWANATLYIIHQIVWDGQAMYRCINSHTSVGIPGTIQDDIANWVSMGVTTLEGLTDVDLDTTAPVASDVLTYNGTEWVPTAKNSLETELILKELAATPSTPDAGYVKLYPKTDKRLYLLDDTGRETLLEAILDIVDFFDSEFILGTTINGNAGSFTEVVVSAASDIKKMQVADTTGLFLGWYIGAAASEALKAVSGPGSDQTVELDIPAGTRISVRSLTTAAGTSGELSANFLG